MGASQDDASKRARHQVNTPSCVIHARNLPADCSENDLYVLATPFGAVVNVLLLKGKNQAFVQMRDIISATALVEFYALTPAMIRLVFCILYLCFVRSSFLTQSIINI